MICFSLVLYNHSLEDIYPLLSSLVELSKIRRICLYICDNTKSPSASISNYLISLPFMASYFHSVKNLGYGMGNNTNFYAAELCDSDLLVVVNPDIAFKASDLTVFFDWFESSRHIVACAAPLIIDQEGHIQYSAKTNPTFLSLLLGRFPVLRILPFLQSFYNAHLHLQFNYRVDSFNVSYLSGCFMVFSSLSFRSIGGFSECFFLHLEDADISRKGSEYGHVVHHPVATVTHSWARGSHKSLIQTFALLSSMIIYFRKWGFRLY